MPVNPAIRTNEVSELIPSQLIPDFVQGFEFAPLTGLSLAWTRVGQGNVPVSFPAWDAFSAAPATKTQAAAFALVNVESDEEVITPAPVGFRMFLSNEAVASASTGVPAGLLSEGLATIADKMDKDILASSTTATQSTGSVSRTYTAQEFQADVALFKALHVPPAAGYAAVLSIKAAHQLAESLHTTAATMPRAMGDTFQLGPESGYQGDFMGFMIFQTSNVPDESTGKSGLLTPVGINASGYGLVVNHMPQVQISMGDDAHARYGQFIHINAYYGVGLTNKRRCLEVLTQ